MQFLQFDSVLFTAGMRVSFTPHTIGADINEFHIGVAIIAFRIGGNKRFEFLEINRVVKKRIPQIPVWRATFAMKEKSSFGARILHPFRRGKSHPAFRTGQAQRDLLTLCDPALGRRIQDSPVILPLFRLKVGPWKTQVDRRNAGKILQCIGGFELGTIVARDVGIEVHRPAHAGVNESLPRVLQLNRGGLLRDGSKADQQPTHNTAKSMSHTGLTFRDMVRDNPTLSIAD